MAKPLAEEAIDRLVRSIVADELGRQRHQNLAPDSFLNWPRTQSFGDDGLDLDSLERLGIAARLNQFFHLFEVGIEDYLLAERQLDGWVGLIVEGQREYHEAFTFQTSGSTGEPKRCAHKQIALQREAAFWAGRLADCRRVIAMVPCHHIYGFLWTIMLPQMLDCPVIDGRTFEGGLRRHLRPNDLIVGVPSQWHYWVESLGGSQAIRGVSATAPLDANLGRRLRHEALDDLIEVFGASDLGGIGWRQGQQDRFNLLPWWHRVTQQGSLAWQAPESDGGLEIKALSDHLDFVDERTFQPKGRVDQAVQVGGLNVYPSQIARQIEACPCVQACVVRLHEQDQLKAFIVPVDQRDELKVRLDVEAWCRETLHRHERPRSLTIGAQLPLDSMGKAADWQPQVVT